MARPLFTPLLLLSLAVAALCDGARAQTHKVTDPEKVVRAVGVYEWTGDLAKPAASRLVPVAIYIDGHFEEAGVYLARPVPFVLDTGFAYDLDEAGISRGTFNMLTAARMSGGSEAFDDPWIGNGNFVPPAAAPRAAALHALKNQPAIVSSKDSDPDRPKLVNKSPDSKSSDTSSTPHPRPDPSTVGTGATPPSTSTSTSGTDSKNDPDRPTLRRPPPPTKEQQKQADAARKKAGQSSVSGPDKPLNDDPDRPTLRRHGTASGETGPVELLGLPADMHQLTAVSDAADRPAHNFARPWDDDQEHTAILRKIQVMARAQLAAYEQANPLPAGADTTTVAHSGPITTSIPTTVAPPDSGPPTIKRGIPQNQNAAAAPSTSAPTAPAPTAPATAAPAAATPATSAKAPAAAKPTTPAHPMTPAAKRRAAAAAAAAAKAAPPPPPIPLLDEQLRGYELSYGGDPTFVYTAHTAGTGAAERFITLVAQQDPISHQLQLAMHSVTDDTHLNRTPEMRPLDAVDADASNRASLLVELRNQDTRQFALYRIMAGRADQIFLSGTTR